MVVPAVHGTTIPRCWTGCGSSAKGATVIGICDGAWVLARAGVLDGRRATGHWYSRSALARQFPARGGCRTGAMWSTARSSPPPASAPRCRSRWHWSKPSAAARALSRWRAVSVPAAGMMPMTPRHSSSACGTCTRRRATGWRSGGMRHWARPCARAPTMSRSPRWPTPMRAPTARRSWRPRHRRPACACAADWCSCPSATAPHCRRRCPMPARGCPPCPRSLRRCGIAARYDDATAGFVALQLEYPEARRPIH